MAASQDEKQIAARYVSALFSLATEQKKLDAVAAELEKLGELLAESADLKALCQSPMLSTTAKMQAVMAIAKKAKMHALVAQLLTVLAANQRLALLPAIVAEFAAQMRAHRGEMVAEVATATKLDAATEKALVASLTKYTGKKVVLAVSQKPEILGGLKIRLGGVMIDASVAGKLMRLKDKLNHGIKQVA
jgi:F-type H+-transporting ATPase subunit delta